MAATATQHVQSGSPTNKPCHFLSHLFDEPLFHHSLPHSINTNNNNNDVLEPPFECYDSDKAYYLEIELPGISRTTDVHLEMNDDNHTLLIEAIVTKPTLESEWDATWPEDSITILGHAAHESPPNDSITCDSMHNHITNGKNSRQHDQSNNQQPNNQLGNLICKSSSPVTQDWVHEHQYGRLKRKFTFAEECDGAKVRARLHAGLLKVMVPKTAAVSLP